jgi:hypothetical protein
MARVRYGRAYLRSRHWREVRRSYERHPTAPHRCAVCGAHRYELHHRTYERLGAEDMGDLLALCRSHHEQLHRAYKTHQELNPGDPLAAFTDAWVLIHRRRFKTAPLPSLMLYGLRTSADLAPPQHQQNGHHGQPSHHEQQQ